MADFIKHNTVPLDILKKCLGAKMQKVVMWLFDNLC